MKMKEKDIALLMANFEQEFPLDYVIDKARGVSGTRRFEIYKFFELVKIRLALQKIAEKK